MRTSTVVAATAAGAAATAAAVVYVYRLNQPKAGDPPCPGSDFLIGSFRHLGDPPLYKFLQDRYPNAPVVLLFLGCTRVYVLNNFTAFKQAMVDNADALSGRLSQKPLKRIFGDFGGLVNSEGDLWRQYRRFSLQTLRDFGLGRKGAEHCITAEVDDLCQELTSSKDSGQSVDIGFLLGRNVSNVICQLVFGSRLASESEEFTKILEFFCRVTSDPKFQENNFRSVAYLPITERFDFIFDLLMKLPQTKQFINMFDYLLDFCDKQVNQHRAEMQEGADARDYIDAHLQHQSTHPDVFNNRRLSFAILDLFLAGTETTANTLRWGLLLMMANPRVASRVHREIVDAVGTDRMPTVADKAKLQFTQATMEEIHRYVSLVPIGVLHRVTEDVNVCGYQLAKNSLVLYNTYKIHRDEDEFPNPERFLPQRHLDAQGHFHPSQRVIAFGAGRRACLGESLARMELLLFFSRLMQLFTFSLDPTSCNGQTPEQLLNSKEAMVTSLTRVLPPFKLFVHPRV